MLNYQITIYLALYNFQKNFSLLSNTDRVRTLQFGFPELFYFHAKRKYLSESLIKMNSFG